MEPGNRSLASRKSMKSAMSQKSAMSRKSAIPALTAVQLTSPEAADLILKAMQDAVDEVDACQERVVHLYAAESALLVLMKQFADLIDAVLRSQGAEVVEIFANRERLNKARAIAMDVQFTPNHAQDLRIKDLREKCDHLEAYLETFEDEESIADSSLVAASGLEKWRSRKSTKSVLIRETLARQRRALAETRSQGAKYRNVMWALSWFYVHRDPDGPFSTPIDDINGISSMCISVKDADGTVSINVEEVSDYSASDVGQDDELAPGVEVDDFVLSRQNSEGTSGTMDSKKRKVLSVSTKEVDIASASPENLVLIVSEEQRSKLLTENNQSFWEQYFDLSCDGCIVPTAKKYLDLVCARSAGEYDLRGK